LRRTGAHRSPPKLLEGITTSTSTSTSTTPTTASH
jgi:hypothetical protein